MSNPQRIVYPKRDPDATPPTLTLTNIPMGITPDDLKRDLKLPPATPILPNVDIHQTDLLAHAINVFVNRNSGISTSAIQEALVKFNATNNCEVILIEAGNDEPVPEAKQRLRTWEDRYPRSAVTQ